MRIFIVLGACAALWLTGCGGAGSPLSGGPDRPAGGLPPLPDLAGFDGPRLNPAQPDGFDAASPDKGPSATFRKFFHDAVNQHSGGRWNTQSDNGFKQWTLVNAAFTAPKAWQLGGNYWNNEDDVLFTDLFTLPAETEGVRLSFYARYNIAAGDSCQVWYWDGSGWNLAAAVSGSSNANWPNWDKFYFELPSNSGMTDADCEVRLRFQSDGAGTSFGYALDSVAVYQTRLNPPVNVSATDGASAHAVDVTWAHDNAGTLVPDEYRLYRSATQGGPYALVDSVNYPGTGLTDTTGDGAQYYYVVRAAKAGWEESVDSAEDGGYGEGAWITVQVDDPAGGDAGYWGDLALVDGHPAICYRDGAANVIRYARSTTPLGALAADWTVVTIATAGITQPGREMSLSVINGNPALSYCDNGPGDLVYHRSSTATGALAGDWSAPVVIHSSEDCGYNSELLTVDGTPAIAYDDVSNSRLMWAHSTTANGEDAMDWDITVLNDPAGSAGACSLAIINGNPAIASFFWDGVVDHLSFKRSSTIGGDSPLDWGTEFSWNATPNGPSLGTVGGFPAITTADISNGDVWFYGATNANGTAWNAPVLVRADLNGIYSSLGIVFGNPAVAYHDNTAAFNLEYTRCTQADGLAGWTDHETVDSTGNVGRYATLIVLPTGQPAIYYRDDSSQSAKYAVKN